MDTLKKVINHLFTHGNFRILLWTNFVNWQPCLTRSLLLQKPSVKMIGGGAKNVKDIFDIFCQNKKEWKKCVKLCCHVATSFVFNTEVCFWRSYTGRSFQDKFFKNAFKMGYVTTNLFKYRSFLLHYTNRNTKKHTMTTMQ